MRAIWALFFGLWVSFNPTAQVRAQSSEEEFYVAGRAATFLTDRSIDTIVVVFDGSAAISQAERLSILRRYGPRLDIGGRTLGITYQNLDGSEPAFDGGAVVYLTRGLEARWDEIARVSQRRNVATIAAGPACARRGFCVVGVEAEPRVRIFISPDAAEAASVKFSTAFQIMAQEV